jgi:hypothetical protein
MSGLFDAGGLSAQSDDGSPATAGKLCRGYRIFAGDTPATTAPAFER